MWGRGGPHPCLFPGPHVDFLVHTTPGGSRVTCVENAEINPGADLFSRVVTQTIGATFPRPLGASQCILDATEHPAFSVKRDSHHGVPSAFPSFCLCVCCPGGFGTRVALLQSSGLPPRHTHISPVKPGVRLGTHPVKGSLA